MKVSHTSIGSKRYKSIEKKTALHSRKLDEKRERGVCVWRPCESRGGKAREDIASELVISRWSKKTEIQNLGLRTNYKLLHGGSNPSCGTLPATQAQDRYEIDLDS